MKQFLAVVVVLCLIAVSAAAQQPKQAAKKAKSSVLKTNEEKMSYLSGYDLGLKVSSNVNANKFPLRSSAFILGLKEALEGKENQMTPEEIKACVEIFQKMAPKSNDDQKLAAIAEKYKKEGAEFLAANAKKDSVKTTASGLQYKILREGTGASPVETSSVTVHYRGQLINGVVFDESYARNEPAVFKVNQVIKGWTEGVMLMKEGAKFEFYIPYNLAYGEQPVGQFIPPGSTLLFVVELIKVN
ncbi:MAG: FKBP-type peptidyl-prolyl cis-trans isomerase [Bacteroidota bacterium]